MRLTRVEMQEHNRAKVLDAAREEFTEQGFRDAKIDSIAERAGLTRGAVYSNFPGKRALYFAVLAEFTPDPEAGKPGRTPSEALGTFARSRAAGLPLATDGPEHLGKDLLPEILAEDFIRRPFAQLLKLNALLLGLAVEHLGGTGRRVRVAEAALTMLYGMEQLAAAAPGFGDPFDTAATCERLAELDLHDTWDPPYLPYIAPARPTDAPWSPPPATDAVRGEPAALTGDMVVAVLGLHRLEAAEEAVRAGAAVTAVLVTGEPGELGPLARLTVAELSGHLRRSFPPEAWPRLQIVHDEQGVLAAAAGVTSVSDATEAAIRVESGRIVARAEGRGACHAAATG